MTRVKRAVSARKKRKKILKLAKGYRWSRSNRYIAAKDAVRHALVHAYKDRRRKKRDFRKLWNVKINAAVRQEGLTYSKFIAKLKKKNIGLDRKVLSELASKYPEIFKEIVSLSK